MNLNLLNRQRKLLKILIAQESWITGANLKDKLDITDRTVRNDIKDINHELKKFGNCLIDSVRGTGYRIAVNDKDKILKLLDSSNNAMMNMNETKEERIRNLAIQVLLSSNPISLYDLEDQMFISRTRLEAVIKSINDKCSQKGAGAIIQRSKNSIFANCGEMTRRALIQDFIVLDVGESGDLLEEGNVFFNREAIEVIGACIHEIFEKDSINLADMESMKVNIYLYIQKIRIESGNILKSAPSSYHEAKNQMIEAISNKIADNMEKNFEISYPSQERAAIALYLSNIRTINTSKLTKETLVATIEPRYIVIVEELLNDIKNEFLLNLTQDEKLFVDLVTHIRFSIGMEGNAAQSCNPILGTIKNKYPFIFELSTYIWHRFYDIFGIELSEDQLSFIAAHLGAAIERLENTKSSSNFSIAVCSNMNRSIVRFLMAKLYSLYGNSINIRGPYPVYNTKKMLQENPSMVLTTTSASLFRDAAMPVIRISPTLEASDILAINNTVGKLKRNSVLFKLPHGIEQYFEKDLFFPQMSFNSQYDLLKFLSEKIIERGYASNDLLANILEREKMAPTSFANMIAMPHPIQTCVYKTVIGVATLDKAILWGNQDVRLVFLLAVRSSDMKYLNSFFDITVDLAQNKKKVQELIGTKDFTKFLKELASESSELPISVRRA